MPNTLLDNKKQPTYSKAEVDALLARAEGAINFNATGANNIKDECVYRTGKTVVVKACIALLAQGLDNKVIATISGVPMPTKNFYVQLVSYNGTALGHCYIDTNGKLQPWGNLRSIDDAAWYVLDTSYVVA
jgi:hypothetical protein